MLLNCLVSQWVYREYILYKKIYMHRLRQLRLALSSFAV